MRIAYIGSLACFGKCSITVAMPVMAALGVEVCPIPTTLLSTHTGGFGVPVRKDLTDSVVEIAKHIKTTGAKFDGIFTGYMGSAWQARAAMECTDILKSENTVIFCDPAMADNGKMYGGLPEDFYDVQFEMCTRADHILPNITEAALMTQREICAPGDKEKLLDMLLTLREETGAQPIITGAAENEDGAGAAVLVDSELVFVKAKLIPGHFHGTGDLFSAVYMANVLKGKTAVQAAQSACDMVSSVVERTKQSQSDERFGITIEDIDLYTGGKL
ncbi:MAG: pyridoxal kinase [Clostridiales bacterium]|nr:pyridoxal kinase [Clostridiales bacterium]